MRGVVHKNFIELIKAAFLLGFLNLFCFSSKSRAYHQSAIEVIYKYPVIGGIDPNDMKLYYITDTFYKYKVDDYIAYKLYSVINYETDEKIKDSSPYFIYKSGSKSGYWFKDIKSVKQGRKYLVEPFLKEKTSEPRDVDITKENNWHFLSSGRDEESGSTYDRYINDRGGSFNDVDTVYYYYSDKLNDINFSFSRRLDSIKNAKLFKTRVILNEEIDSNNVVMPYREFLFEVRLSKNNDFMQIRDLISQVKDSIDNN